ncbi:MAG TPA: MarR family transcriptional regulator [Phenylobacterium sp.]|uniref:MarR family winged helix-turn-helix transcriptional regulator n=1 Tax=Phenylobacterium sp. TaxID=1871053 RepID=UPI002B49736F|nr:MarR family transcriptional regulator [Phenylobacterium sp.]HKR90614.1 MarR family transcriptional regulator [Phenylobacterium sp.]
MTDRRSDERAFTARLLRLTRIYRRETDKALAAHGISDARALPVLQIARLGEGVRQGVLAEELGVEGPSLVRILDQLAAAGLVERRDDPNDRRAKTLHLSDEGRAMAALVELRLDALRSRLLAEIDDADLASALRVFARFEAALETAHRKPRSAGS